MAKKKQQGESLSAYFRTVFEEHPEWLEQKSNDEVLARYRQDHGMAPDEKVGDPVKNAMANIKSQVRKKYRGGSGADTARKGKTRTTRTQGKVSLSTSRMETLEEQIDECMTLARSIDREKLGEVIRHLRRARNQVVWMMGQKD